MSATKISWRGSRAWSLPVLLLAAVSGMHASSVMTHEALVDAAWDRSLKHVLLAHFPNATEDELKTAHGYAYGGSIIQDLGYYPHGSKEFSDLCHYAHSGDFILALLHEAHDVNELAFALGALSHHPSDINIHRYATNVGEPQLYPRLQKKYGNVVTYEEDPEAHLKTEFSFDVLEITRGNFAPEAYHNFIGFHVAKEDLQRAILDTYALNVKNIFPDFDRSVESYRYTVSKLIPRATRVAWAERGEAIRQTNPGMTRGRFVYVMKRSSYERDWGQQYDRPSKTDRFLAFLVELLPPIGPLKSLRFRMPTPAVEALYTVSFTRALDDYIHDLDAFEAHTLKLANVNFDLGTVAKPGEYRLGDESYLKWLHLLAHDHFADASPAVLREVATYLRVSKVAAESPSKQLDEDLAALREVQGTKRARPSGQAEAPSAAGSRR